MVVKTDHVNANVLVERGGKVIHTFNFNEFVPAKDIKPINNLRTEIAHLTTNPKTTQKELDSAEKKYFETIMSKAVTNPISHEDALLKFSLPEINQISEEVLIFLINWSSTEEVKAYASSLAKPTTTSKEEKK